MENPRPRRARQWRKHDLDNALFREALRRWLDWLGVAGDLAGRREPAGAPAEALGTVYEGIMRRIARRADQHTDPVVGRLLAEESRGFAWPASIHAIILDMPPDWRVCLLGTALEYSQAGIGQALGLRQQLVGMMLKRAREMLLLRLRVLARTNGVMREMGVGE